MRSRRSRTNSKKRTPARLRRPNDSSPCPPLRLGRSTQPAPAPDEDFDETLRNTLLLAQRTADQTVKQAQAEAEELRRRSTANADSVMAGARAEAKELKGEAHAQREQMLADAESERAQLLADALEHVQSRKQAIEEELMAEHGLRRNELLGEIGQLEQIRDDLNADVARFEEFIAGRRDSVRGAISDIEAILDDPSQLAGIDVPDPAEIGLLDADDLAGYGSGQLLDLDPGDRGRSRQSPGRRRSCHASGRGPRPG